MIHECSVCWQSGEWSKQWAVYGSIRTEEDGVLVKTCSPRCRGLLALHFGGPDLLLQAMLAMAGLKSTIKIRPGLRTIRRAGA